MFIAQRSAGNAKAAATQRGAPRAFTARKAPTTQRMHPEAANSQYQTKIEEPEVSQADIATNAASPVAMAR
jgi:hypothetical protein